MESGGSLVDVYGPVMYGSGAHVYDETINYPDGTPLQLVLRGLKNEVPPDARLLRQTDKNVCAEYLFHSSLLDEQATALGAYVTVALYSSPDEQFSANDVQSAILVALGKRLGSC